MTNYELKRLEKDYERALADLYVLDEESSEYIPADKVWCGGYITEEYETFYYYDDGEYEIDYRAYDDLKEMEEEIDAAYEESDREHEAELEAEEA